FERDTYLDLVPPIGHVAARLVDVVRVEVDGGVEPAAGARTAGRARAHAIAPHTVFLNTQRIHREHRGPPVVEIRVEQDLDAVVGVDVVAVGERGPHHVPVRFVGADQIGRAHV